MAGFELMDPSVSSLIPHITPLTNLTLSYLQRGHFDIMVESFTRYNSSVYQPPPLELYTKFSLQSYFLAFWGIIFLQMLSIFIIDMVWTRNIPQSSTLWERLMHATLKAHFPIPYANWHEGDGNCKDHIKRYNAANHEVLLTTAVNLFFNLIMLTPMVILCKY